MARSRVTVLISVGALLFLGTGSNLQAIIDACKQGTIPSADVCTVISNRKDAYGLERARQAGIPTTYHNLLKYRRDHPDDSPEEQREGYDRELADLVLQTRPDVVVLAGFMHVLASTFLRPLKEVDIPVINLHPALWGQYNGANAMERAFADWEAGKITKTGIMIHYVIEEVDMGEPIQQREIAFEQGESLEAFQTRVHSLEWPTLVEATKKVLEQRRAAT